jgi:hypothetical protein
MRWTALYRKPNGCEGAVVFDVPLTASLETLTAAAQEAAGDEAIVLRIVPID